MNPLNLMKTNTTRFMLAMIFNDDVTYNDILQDNFIDSYMSDFYKPEYDGYLLVVKSTDEEPSGTINKPIANYQNDDHYIFVYDIPDKYKDDYASILCGDYRSISDEFKVRLLEFWNSEKESMLNLLLYTESKLQERFKYEPLKEFYSIISKKNDLLE